MLLVERKLECLLSCPGRRGFWFLFSVSCPGYAAKLSLGGHGSGMIPCINANPNPCPQSPQTKSWDFSKPALLVASLLPGLNHSLMVSPFFFFETTHGLSPDSPQSFSEKIIPFWKGPCSSSSVSITLGSLHAACFVNLFLKEK